MAWLGVAALDNSWLLPASRALIQTIREALNVAYPMFGLVQHLRSICRRDKK